VPATQGVFPSFIDGPAGALQIRIDLPATRPRALGVLCHPHTLHGGTLTNKVIHQVAHAFNDAGAIAVRFNFRGAGESAGSYDEGRGETDDVCAVVDWARRRWPDLPLWLAGFSFGAYVSLRAVDASDAAMIVTVAPPVNHFAFDTLVMPSVSWLVVQGGADEVVPADAVTTWVRSLSRPPEYELMPDVGHFFHGRLRPLRERVIRFAERR